MRYIVIFLFVVASSTVVSSQNFDSFLEQKQFNKAEEFLSNAKEVDKAILMAKLGDAYLASNYLEDAARHFIQLMDKERIKQLAHKYHKKNKPRKALYYFKFTDEYKLGLRFMAEYYLKKEQSDSAKKYTIQYLEENSVRDNAYHKLVKDIVLLDINKNHFQKAVSFASEYAYTPIKGILAEKLLENKLLDEAYLFRNFTKNKTTFNDKLGTHLYDRKEYEKALDCFKSSGNLAKKNECFLMLARKLLEKGGVKEAEKLYQQAFATEIMNYEIGKYYYEKGKYELASNYYIKLPGNSKYNEIFNHMVVQMKAINNYASAAAYLKKTGKTEESQKIEKRIFMNNDNGTISSTELPILWQESIAGPMTWDQANKHCKALKLAGYSDWLLPDNIAFNTTIQNHFSKNRDLVIQYFPEILNKGFWTKTRFGGTEKSNQFYVIQIKEDESQQLKNKEEAFFVKCYRPFYK